MACPYCKGELQYCGLVNGEHRWLCIPCGVVMVYRKGKFVEV